jgi:hypothetical protein
LYLYWFVLVIKAEAMGRMGGADEAVLMSTFDENSTQIEPQAHAQRMTQNASSAAI